MNFDINRVFTAVNADELKPGDKVITANNMAELKNCVKNDGFTSIVDTIEDEKYVYRFMCKRPNSNRTYENALAYLVERKENCTNCGARWVCPLGVPKDPKFTRCEAYEPLEPKTEQKAENCTNCHFCYVGNKCFCDNLPNEGISYAEAKTHKCRKYRFNIKLKAEPHYRWVNYRPFKDTDELVKVWCEKAKATPPVLNMPYIWVRSKFNKDHKGCLITNFFGKYVLMNNQQCFLSRLFDEYTFLDGSVCGVEE